MQGISNESTLNLWSLLPDEVIQGTIANYLTPREASSLRLVNRRFAQVFGDNSVWRIYYASLGLTPPSSQSSLFSKFPLWQRLRSRVDHAIAINRPGLFSGRKPSPFCLAILAIPQLTPLHGYTLQALKAEGTVPDGLSAEELIVQMIVDSKFNYPDPLIKLVIRSLAKRLDEQPVKELLLSFFTEEEILRDLSEQVAKSLRSALGDPQIFEAMMHCLENKDVKRILPVLDTLITLSRDPSEVVDAIIDCFTNDNFSLHQVLQRHIDKEWVIEKLITRLDTEETESELTEELIRALKPLFGRADVQRVFLQTLVRHQGISGETAFRVVASINALLSKGPPFLLLPEVVSDFANHSPEIGKFLEVEAFFPTIAADHTKLFKALSSENAYLRAKVVGHLVPLVPDDPKVVEAFLAHIRDAELGMIDNRMITALAPVADREDVRSILLKGGTLTGWKGNIRSLDHVRHLSTIQVLAPYIEDEAVFLAFQECLKHDESDQVRCTLIKLLAPYLERDVIRTLFIAAAKGEFWHQPYISPEAWQAAAIEQLQEKIELAGVQDTLKEIFSSARRDAVKAACIRALCAHKEARLLTIDELVTAILSDGHRTRAAARHELERWVDE